MECIRLGVVDVGFPRDRVDVHANGRLLLRLFFTVGRRGSRMRLGKVSLQQMFVSIRLDAVFIRARKVPFPKMRYVVVGVQRFFLFASYQHCKSETEE